MYSFSKKQLDTFGDNFNKSAFLQEGMGEIPTSTQKTKGDYWRQTALTYLSMDPKFNGTLTIDQAAAMLGRVFFYSEHLTIIAADTREEFEAKAMAKQHIELTKEQSHSFCNNFFAMAFSARSEKPLPEQEGLAMQVAACALASVVSQDQLRGVTKGCLSADQVASVVGLVFSFFRQNCRRGRQGWA